VNVRKLIAVTALGLMLTGMVAEQADARAGRSGRTGGYSSFGYRGTRTNESQGFRAIAPGQNRSWGNPAAAQRSNPGAAAQRPSWFQRNPFLAGLTGALAGSALFSALGGLFGFHGGGFGGGGGGGLLPLLLLGFAGFMAYRWLRNRQQTSYATGGYSAPSRFEPRGSEGPSLFGDFGRAPVIDAGAYRQSKEQGLAAIALNNPGFDQERMQDELSSVFFRIQEAWSADDRAVLRSLTSPEVYEQFVGDLEEMARRGERNVVKNAVMRSMDVTEAWTEQDDEFVTVAIHARVIDYLERKGQIVEGSATQPTDFREVWTFGRRRGDDAWQLSAINQTV